MINATLSLWFRVVITVKSREDVAIILSSTGLKDYLSRTDGLDIPLDIEIQYHDRTGDFTISPGGVPDFFRKSLVRSVNRWQEQLNCILALLADMQPHTGDVETSSRIDRWRSLLSEADETLNDWMDPRPIVGSWLQNQSYSAPRLTNLILRDIPNYYQPHEYFAPNLKCLSLEGMCTVLEYHAINTPGLRSLSLQSNDVTIPWEEMSGICAVEELSVEEPKDDVTYLEETISLDFPNLKRLEIRGAVCPSLLLQLTDQFRKSSRRLAVVHLVDYDFGFDLGKFPDISILTNAHKIIFEIQSDSNADYNEPPDISVSLSDMRKFLGICATDTEVVAVGEDSERILALAREDISYAWMLS